MARLSAELDDIPHKITPLLWSGANSIFVRDKTAHALAEHLATENTEHPQATQLIIAHSHGGNIALRALHQLQHRHAPSSLFKPFVVALATPFIEVHSADWGKLPSIVRLAVVSAIWYFVAYSNDLADFFFAKPLFQPRREIAFAALAAGLIPCSLWFWWWQYRRHAARQNQINALYYATQLDGSNSGQRLLMVRAVEDEASLVLALGTIINYLTSRTIRIALLIFVPGLFALLAYELYELKKWWLDLLQLMSAGLPPELIEAFKKLYVGMEEINEQMDKHRDMLYYTSIGIAGWITSTFVLFGMLMISRSVHGRELAVGPMECQINTQSAPDAEGLSKIVTLIRKTYAKSLRHGIYDHEDCVKTISDWVRSQLVCTAREVGTYVAADHHGQPN